MSLNYLSPLILYEQVHWSKYVLELLHFVIKLKISGFQVPDKYGAKTNALFYKHCMSKFTDGLKV